MQRSHSTILLLFVTVSGGIVCAAAGGGGQRDVRASATLGRAGPRMLVAGPALLVHVDVDGGNELARR